MRIFSIRLVENCYAVKNISCNFLLFFFFIQLAPSSWHSPFRMWIWAFQFKTVKWFSCPVISHFILVHHINVQNCLLCAIVVIVIEIWPFVSFVTYHISSGTEAHHHEIIFNLLKLIDQGIFVEDISKTITSNLKQRDLVYQFLLWYIYIFSWIT